MKAERAEPKQEFVPVIVTLESQEEVDGFYAIIDNTVITSTISVFHGWQPKLKPFRSPDYRLLFKMLDKLLG